MSGNPQGLFARELEGVLEKYYALKEARHRHPYVGDLIRLLLLYPEGLSRQLAIHELKKQRRQDGLPIPAAFKTAVQSSYNHYSADSDTFKKRGAPKKEALFYSPAGKGSGRWAVHPERALHWLKAKLGEPRLL